MKVSLVALLLLPLLVSAYTSPGQPAGFVNDFGNLLSSEEEASLNSKLEDFRDKTTHEIAVVTVSSLEGDTIENYAVKLFEEWEVGTKEDDGVLLLVSEQDRRVRIEVGYGLEGDLTDAESFWIIENDIKPAFQEENYFEGLNKATDSIIKSIEGEFVQEDSWEEVIPVILIILIFLAFRFFIWKAGGPFIWWGGPSGGFGGGSKSSFGGFSGGSSGGGGSSGSW